MTETSKKKNRGYSLIELIVTIAIASILVIVVGTVMVSSATSYSAANAEATVQTRAQIVMNQIEDLVIDTRGGVDYGYMSGADSVAWGNLKDSEDMSQPYGKRLRLYNVYTGSKTKKQVCELEWKSDDKTLLYREYDSADGENVTSSTEELLSENVSDFACDLTEVSTNRVLKVNLTMTKGHLRRIREYHAYKNISLRNPITVSGSAITSTDEVSLVLTNKYITVEPGMSLALYGARAVVVSGTPTTEVKYSLVKYPLVTGDTGNPTSGSTTVENDKTLKVGSDEKAKYFTVRATSVQDTDQTKDITVYVRRVNEVKLDGMTAYPRAIPGAKVTVKAQIDAQTDTKITKKDREKLYALEFKVSPAVSDLKTSGSTCTFTIPADAQEGTRYKVTVEALHARDNGGMTRGAYKVNYLPAEGTEELWKNVVEVLESGSTVSTVLNTVIYRGQEKVTLDANPYTNLSEAGAGKIFLYRTLSESAWGFKSDMADAIPDGWTVIGSHDDISFTVPDAVYSEAKINEERAYQFAAVAYFKSDSKYHLLGRGEFRMPAFKLQINDKTDGKLEYKLFELRGEGDKTLPREIDDKGETLDPIHIGQVERAFKGVRYKNSGDEGGYGEIKVSNGSKEIDKDHIKTSTSDPLNLNFRIDELKKAGIEYPSYLEKTSVSFNTLDGWNKEYDLEVSEVSYSNSEGTQKLTSGLDKPSIHVETYIGNAVFQVRGSKYTDAVPVYDYWPVFIPVPGSTDDLLNSYSFKQLETTYRPAGDTQGVYINTMKPVKDTNTGEVTGSTIHSDQSTETRYLIQMKVQNGVRYIRVWYPGSVKVDENDKTFTGKPKYFIGEYKYDEDKELWKRISTTAPTYY